MRVRSDGGSPPLACEPVDAGRRGAAPGLRLAPEGAMLAGVAAVVTLSSVEIASRRTPLGAIAALTALCLAIFAGGVAGLVTAPIRRPRWLAAALLLPGPALGAPAMAEPIARGVDALLRRGAFAAVEAGVAGVLALAALAAAVVTFVVVRRSRLARFAPVAAASVLVLAGCLGLARPRPRPEQDPARPRPGHASRLRPRARPRGAKPSAAHPSRPRGRARRVGRGRDGCGGGAFLLALRSAAERARRRRSARAALTRAATSPHHFTSTFGGSTCALPCGTSTRTSR
jgi:hypothetical protein